MNGASSGMMFSVPAIFLLGYGYVARNTVGGPDPTRFNDIEGLEGAGVLGQYGDCASYRTLIGDPNPYHPWLNVPAVLSLFTHYGLDANDYFGNLIYMAGAYMDETQFPHKSKSVFMKAARKALNPLQKAIFLQAGGEKTEATRLVSKFFTWLGSQ